jgi:hypothetical protein
MRSVAAKAACPPVLAASVKDLSLMRPPAVVALVVVGLAATGCSRTMPLYNVSSAPIAVASESSSATQVRGALIEAKAEPASAAQERDAIIQTKAGPSSEVHGAIIEAKAEQLSAAQVRDAIIEAATDRGWIVKEDDPGRILLETYIRRHSATVTVDYSPTAYDITYTDSENLLYDGTNIHKNYNEWIRLLQEQINRRLSEA